MCAAVPRRTHSSELADAATHAKALQRAKAAGAAGPPPPQQQQAPQAQPGGLKSVNKNLLSRLPGGGGTTTPRAPAAGGMPLGVQGTSTQPPQLKRETSRTRLPLAGSTYNATAAPSQAASTAVAAQAVAANNAAASATLLEIRRNTKAYVSPYSMAGIAAAAAAAGKQG